MKSTIHIRAGGSSRHRSLFLSVRTMSILVGLLSAIGRMQRRAGGAFFVRAEEEGGSTNGIVGAPSLSLPASVSVSSSSLPSSSPSSPVFTSAGGDAANAVPMANDPVTGSVSGRVFFDSHGDGTHDMSFGSLDFGMNGVGVDLFSCADEMMLTTTVTGDMGYYSFEGLPGGQYYISATPPKYYGFTDVWNGMIDELSVLHHPEVESTVNPDTGRSVCFDLEEGGGDVTITIGLKLVVPSVDGLPANAKPQLRTPATSKANVSVSSPSTSPTSGAPLPPAPLREQLSTMSTATDSSHLDTLTSSSEEWKYGPSKNNSLIRSTCAIISLVASLLLVWILHKSRTRFTSTYHRLILGMSVSDILFSLSLITFGLIVPRDLNYSNWNARGSEVTCDIFGFMNTWGLFTMIIYSCSLNLYYVALIIYKKPESYIAKKLEPWFHAVPMLFGLTIVVISVAQKGINGTNEGGTCGPYVYNPLHCEGVNDGQIPDGFEIPCGRGRSFYEGFGYVMTIVYTSLTTFFAPAIIGVSLLLIHRSVSRQEQRIRRYGAGAHNLSRAANDDNVAEDTEEQNTGIARSVSSILSSIRSSIQSRFGRGSRSTNQDSSRAVSQRAIAYSISYFLTWVWAIVYVFLFLAGMWPTDFPPPAWTVTFSYFWNFFTPLQGLWTFLIHMHPKVAKVRRLSEGDKSWFGASVDALRSAMNGTPRLPERGEGAPQLVAQPL